MRITLQQQLLARHMLLSGYVTHIIQIETGVPPKTIRLICKYLIDEGYRIEKRSRAMRTSKTLIYDQLTKLHASLLMQIYHRFGGDRIMTSIDIEALTYAFKTYITVFNNAPEGFDLAPRKGLFEISDAWFLANEIRSNEAMLLLCPDCSCTFFTAIDQGTLIDCPFCYDDKAFALDPLVDDDMSYVQGSGNQLNTCAAERHIARQTGNPG